MKNENQEKKNFITNIREMTTREKVLLGLESFCYVAITGSLTMMGIAIAGEKYGYLLSLGLITGAFAIHSQVFRMNRSIEKLKNNTMKNLEATRKMMDENQKRDEERQLRR